MKYSLLAVTYSLLAAAGLIALARWLHPATFSPQVVTVLLILFAGCGTLYHWRHE